MSEIAYGPYQHGRRWRVVVAHEDHRETVSFDTHEEARSFIEHSRREQFDLSDVLGNTVEIDVDATWVYFLMRGERVVYVGQSDHVSMRARAHRKNGLDFDSVRYLPAPMSAAAAQRLEVWLIWKLQPELNARRLGNETVPNHYQEPL